MKKRSPHSTKFGFSFVELLVVATIVVILSATFFVSTRSGSRSARDARRKKDASQVRTALELYYEIYKSYPSAGSVSSLISNSTFQEYLQNQDVEDPVNRSPYQYSFSSNGVSYQFCYRLELTGVQECEESLGDN